MTWAEMDFIEDEPNHRDRLLNAIDERRDSGRQPQVIEMTPCYWAALMSRMPVQVRMNHAPISHEYAGLPVRIIQPTSMAWWYVQDKGFRVL